MKTLKIYNFDWRVIFVDRSELQGSDGRTCANEFTIKLANDMKPPATRLTFIHELIHAILCCQGRWYQKKFTQEEICELFAYIYSMVDDLYDQYLGDIEP